MESQPTGGAQKNNSLFELCEQSDTVLWEDLRQPIQQTAAGSAREESNFDPGKPFCQAPDSSPADMSRLPIVKEHFDDERNGGINRIINLAFLRPSVR